MQNLDISRPLDVHRWSDYPEVNQWVNQLWDAELSPYFNTTHAKSRGKKPKQTARNIFKVLILDLYVAWLEHKDLSIGVSRTHADYRVGSRYNALFISDTMIKVLDACLEGGLVEQHLGNEASGKVTRVWATLRLVDHFKTAKFCEYLIGFSEERECIILNQKGSDGDPSDENQEAKRKGKAKPIEYCDTDSPIIIPARETLTRYNRLLNDTFIDLRSAELPYVEHEQLNKDNKRWETRRISLRQDNKFVRRIFYRGNWSLGGRYHGGWWQQIPSEMRHCIMINDEPTQEVDFSGFHIALSYALEGLEAPHDPYRLTSVLDGLTAEQQRKDVKQLVLTAINARDRNSAFNAFRADKNTVSPTARTISYTNLVLNQLLEEFLHSNRPIEHYVCTDKGVELMALDGRISSHIIKYFTDQNITVLTIHDSYVIPMQHEMRLMTLMQEACQQETGLKDFSLKPEKLTPQRAMRLGREDALYDHLKDVKRSVIEESRRTNGYLRRLQKFQEYRNAYVTE
jgi:hypothetical protein